MEINRGKKHDKRGKKLQWLLRKIFVIECEEKWFSHQPEPVLENERCKILYEFEIQTDEWIEHQRTGILVIDKEKREGNIFDIAVYRDQKIKMKN